MRTYAYRKVKGLAPSRLGKPLARARLALVTTGALHLPSQPPFDDDIKGGDFSFREIPLDADIATLGIAHRSKSFDASGLEADRNVGFPLDRLRELAASGEIGPLNGRHLSFMGSITAPGRLMKESAPEAARLLAADGVEGALLVPL